LDQLLIDNELVCSDITGLPAFVLSLVSRQTTRWFSHANSQFKLYSYIVHSSFILLFPLHLGYLLLTTHHSFGTLLSNLSSTISTQLTSRGFQESRTIHSSQFLLSRFLVVVLIMTALYSIPALLWFIAVVYAPYVVNDFLYL
jgi:hypothetical protein